jgi:O-antigen/teichoic acid export membrane protein
MILYVVILVFAYPKIISQNFSFAYTSILIIAISISSFSRYYFGLVDGLLLNSDQRGYINYNIQIITLILNTIACVILIRIGKSLQFVKLATAFIYLLRPIAQRIYINRHYSINRKISYQTEPIKQKWNGVAQHIAAIILDSTDSIVLSIFSSLSNVSIYSIYYLVVSGIKKLILSMTKGIQAYIGELWATQKIKELELTFGWVEWIIHTGTVLVFGCIGMLILPFIQVYTNGITDVNYYQPVFAILITFANAIHCLRLPYNMLILAAGHYKETQRNYIIAAIMNIIISIVTVKIWGLIGVAIGTLSAMFYQTVWMAIYDSKNIIKWPIKSFIKQLLIDTLTIIICVIFTIQFKMSLINYLSWSILAFKIFGIWLLLSCLINFVFYKQKVIKLYQKIGAKVLRK